LPTVARLEGRVGGQLALKTDAPVQNVGRPDVRVDRVEPSRKREQRFWQRELKRCRERGKRWNGRAQRQPARRKSRLPRVERERLREAGVAARRRLKGNQPFVVRVDTRARADHRFAVAEQLAQDTALGRRAPREAHVGRRVDEVGCVRAGSLLDLRIANAVERARLERRLRRAEQILDRRVRVDAVRIVHGAGEFPTQAVVDRQSRRRAPRILRVHAADRLRLSAHDGGQRVLVRVLVDVVRAGNAADPAGEKPIEQERRRQIRRTNAWDRRGAEDRRHRIAGGDAKVEAGPARRAAAERLLPHGRATK